MTPEEGEEQSHSRAVRDQQRVRQPVFRQPDPSKGLFTLRLLFSFDTICFWDCAWNVVNNMNMTSTYVKRVLAALFNLKAIFKGNWKNYRDCWIISHPRLKRKTWHSHFVVGIKNIAPSGGVDETGDEVRWCMLIYIKAREQSPEAANALLQVQIACGLWRDRWPKVRHQWFISHMSPSWWGRAGWRRAPLLEPWPWLVRAEEPRRVQAGKNLARAATPHLWQAGLATHRWWVRDVG